MSTPAGLAGHADAVIDCRGQRCPLPIIGLAKRLATVEIGQVVRVIADDPATARDIPAWCRIKGQGYVGAGTVDDTPAFDVRRIS